MSAFMCVGCDLFQLDFSTFCVMKQELYVKHGSNAITDLL